MKLRPYQNKAYISTLYALDGHGSTLLVLATGCGKTVVFSHIINTYVTCGKRVLVLAHRSELLDQAQAKLASCGVHNTAIERGKLRSDGERVVIGSVQSMQRKSRLDRFERDAFDLIVVDEAHHATAKGYQRILDYFEGAQRLGVTATPDRLDRVGLGQVFKSVAFEYPIPNAIRDGWLVPIRSHRVMVNGLDLSSVRTSGGDLNERDLAEQLRVEKALHEVVDPLIKLAGDRPTLVFAVDVEHARDIAEVINRHKPGAARALSGGPEDTKIRPETLAAYAAGEFQYLVNCQLFTEGWDESSVSCVVLARPTKSRALYTQMIGRGTRLHPGKHDLLVLDFTGNAGKHRLITTMDVLAGKTIADEQVIAAAELMSGLDLDGLIIDDLEALAMAMSFLEADRIRDEEQAKITAVARFYTEEIDPFMAIEKPDDRGVEPPDDSQINFLDKHGMIVPGNLTQIEVAGIVDGLLERRKRGLCSWKQSKWLKSQKCPIDTSTMSGRDASSHMGNRLAWLKNRRGKFTWEE